MRELSVDGAMGYSRCEHCRDPIFYDDDLDEWVGETAHCSKSPDGRHWER